MSFVTREVKPYFERSITPLVEFLVRKGVHPNYVTFGGLLLIGAGSLALFMDAKLVALVLLGAGALLDAVDGAVARRMGIQSEFGAFLDSTVDRLSDSLPFLALGVLYAQLGEPVGVFLSFSALIGSYSVSYARARAESLGVYGVGGFFERTERWVVLLLGIATDLVPLALVIISIGGFLTAVQRIIEVKRSIDRRFL